MKKFLQIATICALTFGLAASCNPDDAGTELSAPTGLKAGTITQTTAALSWDAVEGADKYRVAVGETEPAEVTGASYGASGLSAATTYKWKVQAVRGDVASEWSAESEFTTPGEGDTTVPAPTDLKVANVTHNSAALSWKHAGGADYHEVSIGGREPVKTFETGYQASGLDTGTEYSWKVRSRKDAEWSDWAEGTAFTTQAEANTEFPYALYGSYFGDKNYGAGTSNFRVGFSTFDPNGEDDGWECHLDIIAAAVDDSPEHEYLEIPAGTYPINTSGDANTVNVNQFTTYLTEWIGFSGIDHFIVGGTVTVEGDGSECTITFDLNIYGGTKYKGHYHGPMMIKNSKSPASPFTEDQDLGTLPMYGGVIYRNDVFGNDGDVDNYAVIGMSPGVSVVDGSLMGTGWVLGYINFFAPVNSGATLPDDTYEIAYSTAAGDVTMGYVNSNNELAGIWARRLDNNAIRNAAIVSGTVQTTYSGGTYTIVVNGKDDRGNDIVGTITGSGSSPAPAAAISAFPENIGLL